MRPWRRPHCCAPGPPGRHCLPATDRALRSRQRPQLQGTDTSALTRATGWVDLDHDALFGNDPVVGAQVQDAADGQRIAVLAHAPSFAEVFTSRMLNYAVTVFLLMMALLASSQLLIRFLLSHLNTLRT